MAKHERVEPIVVWESTKPEQAKKDETVIPFPSKRENSDQFVRVFEPIPGGRPLRITQVSSGFGNPTSRASLGVRCRVAA
ncbi:hypothetical protein [Desmospora activa]|uniref:Uncharacterized protein n=1 Tax=Desmospora activa DSM 45169 TaxID=1121389 RepID=A0A2T4ZCN6_9BACL|nr:hypothetical protein [Desmospora activa]PTM59639.1 hypothetical protein C8J48_2268 [Desmospora activa DSM 45169]